MVVFTILFVVRLFTAGLHLVLLLLNRFFGPETRPASFREVNELFPNIAGRLKQSCLLRLPSILSLVRGKEVIVMARELALAPSWTSSTRRGLISALLSWQRTRANVHSPGPRGAVPQSRRCRTSRRNGPMHTCSRNHPPAAARHWPVPDGRDRN
jgi:hypothetical protein